MKADARLMRLRRAQRPLTRGLWGAGDVRVLAPLRLRVAARADAAAVVVGLRDMYGELYERSERLDPFILFILPVLATLSSSFLLARAEYNRLRFTGNERRGAYPDVPVSEIAEEMGAVPGVPESMRRHRVLVLRMDDAAHPVAVEAVPLPAPRRT